MEENVLECLNGFDDQPLAFRACTFGLTFLRSGLYFSNRFNHRTPITEHRPNITRWRFALIRQAGFRS